MSIFAEHYASAVLGAAIVLAFATQADAQRSGTICSETHTYDPHRPDPDNEGEIEPGPWLAPITDAQLGCTNFQTELGGTKLFNWYTAYGEIHAMETRTTWEKNVEDADILYVVGHGNSANMSGHQFCGSRINDRLESKRMRLGNNGRGLRILSMWSCDTLTPYPVDVDDAMPAPFPSSYTFEQPVLEDVWARWQKAMSGGLKIITGAWQAMHISRMDIMGKNYGKYLKAGSTIAEAWKRASFDSSSSNTPMILATGTNPTDCTNRLYNMTMSTSTDASFPKLRDSAIGHHCWHAWW